MKKTIFLAAVSSSLGLGFVLAESDCSKISLSVRTAVASEQSQVLEIVENEVRASPGCACEVVKAAIEGSGADVKTVAAIVKTAITAAPDQMRLIAECAIAVVPDALAEVNAVLAKIDPNVKVDVIPNPLDSPGMKGTIGKLLPNFQPVTINPPSVTDAN